MASRNIPTREKRATFQALLVDQGSRPDCSPIASLEGGPAVISARRLTEGVVLPQSRRQAAVTDPRPQREPQGGRILSAPTVWRSSGQPVGGASRSARRSPSRRRGGGSACPAGMSPPGGTGAKQKERSGAFAAFTRAPTLSVVIRQGSAGRGKPLPQCLPRERGRCPSAHTGADEVLDLSSGRFVNRPYDAAGRGSGGDQRSPLRRDGTHAYPPVTVTGSGDSPL